MTKHDKTERSHRSEPLREEHHHADAALGAVSYDADVEVSELDTAERTSARTDRDEQNREDDEYYAGGAIGNWEWEGGSARLRVKRDG
jgi:hypothetical protein